MKQLALAALPPDALAAVERRLEAEQTRRVVENRLAHYAPYPKQRAFHTAGADHRERLLMAGNQLGKTLAGGFEAAMHATGKYPDWWKGHRFDRPTVAWVGSPTGITARQSAAHSCWTAERAWHWHNSQGCPRRACAGAQCR